MTYATPTLIRMGDADQVILGGAIPADRDRVMVGGKEVEPLPQFPFTSDGILDGHEPPIPQA